jgi:hypothetical protein
MNNSNRCFYTGILLKKQISDFSDKEKIPVWKVCSREHIVNRGSVLYKNIVYSHGGHNSNVVACSLLVNNAINSFHLYMKVRLRQLHRELYPHFHKSIPYNPTRYEFENAFANVKNRVVKELDHDEHIQCANRFFNSPLIVAWDFITLKNYFPSIKINPIDANLLVSEIR